MTTLQTKLCDVKNDYVAVMKLRVQAHIDACKLTAENCEADLLIIESDEYSELHIRTNNPGLLVKLGILVGKHLEHRADKISV